MPSEETTSPPGPARDWWIPLGLGVSALSAAVSSFDGLRSLAAAAGWTSWMAPALPATVDALAVTATGIWITGTAAPRVRRFARTCALTAILFSIGGNAVWHLVAANLLTLNWAVILAVGTVPPFVLGLVSHLAALRRLAASDRPKATIEMAPVVVSAFVPDRTALDPPAVVPEPSESPSPSQQTLGRPPKNSPVSKTPRRVVSRDDLLEEARKADVEHQEAVGKPITRDALRRALHISGNRATDVLRRLRAEA